MVIKDHLCDRLMRSTQNRQNRIEMINSLFRKKVNGNVRFNEATLRRKISEMSGDKLNSSPKRMMTNFDVENSFDRTNTLDESGFSSNRNIPKAKRNITISPKKFKTPSKMNKTLGGSPPKTVKLRKTIKHFRKSDMKSRLSNTINGSFNLSQKSLQRKSHYGYKNYALGSEYHVVSTKNDKSYDQKGNFEIVPNIVNKLIESHIPSVEFDKSSAKKLANVSNFHSSMNRRKNIIGNYRMKVSKYGNFKGGKL